MSSIVKHRITDSPREALKDAAYTSDRTDNIVFDSSSGRPVIKGYERLANPGGISLGTGRTPKTKFTGAA
jgi:hypothetical protein